NAHKGPSTRPSAQSYRPSADMIQGPMRSSRTPKMAVPTALAAALVLGGAPLVNAQQPDGYGAFLDTVEVRVVNVDVIVTDKSGAFRPGLTREDFVLKVDGKPVEISNFAAF